MKIKIGSKFLYKSSGKHEHCTLIVLHDYRENNRFLWNMTYGVRHGVGAILYSDYAGIASKEEIKNETIKAGIHQLWNNIHKE